MYVSMKRMSKVGGDTAPARHSFFSDCGWCQFILSPCSGWPSQHIQNCAFQASNQCARSKSRHFRRTTWHSLPFPKDAG